MMKKLMIIMLVCLFPGLLMAEMITLDSGEALDPPVNTHLRWKIVELDGLTKVLRVRYQRLGADGSVIYRGDQDGWKTWTCTNIPDDPETEEVDETDNCFSSIFSFNIRQQDVGMSIGVGLRQLIFNQFKADVLSEGNDGTFSQ
jgi:hypothetical protein